MVHDSSVRPTTTTTTKININEESENRPYKIMTTIYALHTNNQWRLKNMTGYRFANNGLRHAVVLGSGKRQLDFFTSRSFIRWENPTENRPTGEGKCTADRRKIDGDLLRTKLLCSNVAIRYGKPRAGRAMRVGDRQKKKNIIYFENRNDYFFFF